MGINLSKILFYAASCELLDEDHSLLASDSGDSVSEDYLADFISLE